MFDAVFANISAGFSQQFGGPFADATAVWPGTPTEATDGSIATPGTPVSKPCKAQVSAPTEGMRAEDGFRQTDMRLIVLTATLTGRLDTDAKVTLASGPHTGTWSIESAMLDTAGIGWVCRGRKLP